MNRNRREPYPFRAGSAAVVEVQPRMIHQNRKAAANQDHHEEEVEEVTVTNPEREAVWPCSVRHLNAFRYPGHTCYDNLDPCRRENGHHHYGDANENGRTHPNPKPPIFWDMHRAMCRIKMGHT